MPVTPELAELLRAAIVERLSDVHVALPGKVVAYDATKQVADVQPQIKRTIADSGGNPVDEDLPILPCVPVEWPRGGGFFVHLPLAAGDFGLITFCERAIDTWRAKGQLTSAGDRRLHGLSGAVFRPGLSPSASPAADASADDLTLGKDGGSLVRIKPDGTIEVGTSGGTFQAVALADEVEANFTTIKTAIAGAAVVAADGGAALKTNIGLALTTPPFPSAVGSSKLKAEE